jgi:type III pantothenate kinase
MNSILAVDVGNTTIGLCLFLKLEDRTKFFIKKIPTHPVQSANRYKKIIVEFIKQKIGSSLQPSAFSLDSVISSVVPPLNISIAGAIKEICGRQPLVVSHTLDCGLAFDVKHPEKIGADRIANAVAGFDYFKKPVAVIDFGTATTITAVGRQYNCHPVLLGGAIMPGINLMQRSLHEGTSKLPSTLLKMPKTALGKNTVLAITSGIVFGTAGAIETLIKSMEKELNFRLKLILTGGHAKLMSPLIKRNHCLAPNLTFEGLRLIYIKARSSHA